MFNVTRYNASNLEEWNDFLEQVRNNHFFFNRNYMDYHQDRFIDHSVFIKDELENIIAVLPANEKENTIISHGGLSFGGLIIDKNMGLVEVKGCFGAIVAYYRNHNFNSIYYKPVPSFYHDIPAQEDLYCLFTLDAELVRRDSNTVLLPHSFLPYQTRRRRGVKKAIKNGLTITEDAPLTEFWNEILTPNLWERHQLKPVHSIQEITFLKGRFDSQIIQVSVYHQDGIVGGCTLFKNKNVVHTQYISSNAQGRDLGALDLLFDFLCEHCKKNNLILSFGISNENEGRTINEGLNNWKESYGASIWVQDHYLIKI
jgi:hypothetical protein